MNMPKGSGIAIGLAIGIAIGVALDNIGVGIALGVAFGVAFDARHYAKGGEGDSAVDVGHNPENQARSAEREAQVARVFAEIQKRGEMTNDDVQAFLSVSDATAERYLQELEAAGKIVQVGEVGQAVKYRVR